MRMPALKVEVELEVLGTEDAKRRAIAEALHEAAAEIRLSCRFVSGDVIADRLDARARRYAIKL